MDTGTIVIIIVAGFVGLLIILGITFFWMRSKAGKKHPFLLYSKDGKNVRTIQAKLKKDPQNKSNKLFFFEAIDQSLDIREPTKWIDGQGYREIIQNQVGEYSYLKTKPIDDSKELELGITPEEKTIALARYKENQQRYENPLSKTQAYLLIGGFILALLIGVGIVYSVISLQGFIGKALDVTKQNNEVAKTNKAIADSNRETTERLAEITALLVNNKNITRTIS